MPIVIGQAPIKQAPPPPNIMPNMPIMPIAYYAYYAHYPHRLIPH